MSYCINEKLNDSTYITHGMSDNYTYQLWFCDSNYSICHRIDGPAVMRMGLSLPGQDAEVYREWWYKGTAVECSSQEEFERLLKLKVFW